MENYWRLVKFQLKKIPTFYTIIIFLSKWVKQEDDFKRNLRMAKEDMVIRFPQSREYTTVYIRCVSKLSAKWGRVLKKRHSWNIGGQAWCR